ncbi:MAG: DUF6353 family protein [Paenisporosarcina sp.]
MKLKLTKIIPASVTRKIGRQLLRTKKHSPSILFVGGVAGSVTGTILACRATLKLSSTLDEIQNDIHTVRELRDGDPDKTNYPTEEWRRDTAYVYTKGALKLVRLYAPATVVYVVSIGFLTGSHVQLHHRNSALMAAYATVQQAYDNYRDRVRDQLGAERELELYHAVTTETGKNELGEKVEIKRADPNKWSAYAKFFDEGSRFWNKEPEFNRIFVQCQQNYANNLLRETGHLFLNEVYDMLGIERTKAGQVVGWVMGGEGDNYIDFGIFDVENASFVNGHELSILLDFNVDGVIYDKI